MIDERYRGHRIQIIPCTAPADTVDDAATADTGPAHADREAGGLLINGYSVEFQASEDGYHITYLPPEPSLYEAARSYVRTARRTDV